MASYHILLIRKKAAWTIIFGCLILCLLLGGCRKQEPDLVLELDQAAFDSKIWDDNEESVNPTTEEKDKQEIIYVYVCGAVSLPGVVALPAGSRADDAVKAAGYMTEEADTSYINLAAVVTDGEKLFIPTREEAEVLVREQVSEGSGLININRADVSQLCMLPGIGESRAADIIAYREKNGPYGVIEDIMKVSGIKDSVFNKICDRITVD